MYNRYIPSDAHYEPIPPPQESSRREAQRPPLPPGDTSPLKGIIGRLGGLLHAMQGNELDRGDILLVLILLFLFLESDDNLELVITLGLLLVFGLFGTEDDTSPDQSSP